MLLWSGMLLNSVAQAQTSTYTNTTTNVINATTSCGGNEFTRVFTVPGTDDFTVGDLDVGLLITHTWRGDVPIDLSSPAGPTVRLVNPNTGSGSQDNYNIELDDAAATVVNTAPHDTGDGTTAPPYENLVQPNSPLSAFNGQNSVGDWTLTMCDDFPTDDDGQFERAELFFTHATDADLSLSLNASNTTPTTGTNVTLTFTIANAGINADGVSVDINLPAGLTHVSNDGGGDYDTGTGVWTIPGTISGGSTASLQITAFVELIGPYDVSAEIETSNQTDPDSTPGNGSTTEDDDDAVTIVPVTPPVPSLLCPGAASVLDWDTAAWPTGSLTNSYTVAGETLSMTFSDPNSTLLNNATFGGQSPAEQTTFTGGFAPVQSSVGVLADQPNQASSVDISLSLGSAGTGVEKFQLTIFDIDFGASQFQDLITITGSLNGSNVTPVLTTGSAHSASGTVVTGDVSAGSASGAGNLTIQFNSAVDTVTINYGNGAGAPANPGQQGIGIHDLFFCPVAPSAVLTAAKSTAVFDPLTLGLYAVPGNDVIYSIDFTNEGDGGADADSVVIFDALPPEIEFYNGDIDDGGPETDPVVGIDNASGLTLTYASDVAYSNAGAKPASMAACDYTPDAGYDPNVTYICFNPKGSMLAGDPDPSFQLQFRARIK